MSTDVITGNDLKAILGEVLPASQGVFCEQIWTNPNGHTNLTCTMGETDSVTPTKSLLLYDGLIVEFRNFYNTASKSTDILFKHSPGMTGRISINAPYSNPTINYARGWYPNTEYNTFLRLYEILCERCFCCRVRPRLSCSIKNIWI